MDQDPPGMLSPTVSELVVQLPRLLGRLAADDRVAGIVDRFAPLVILLRSIGGGREVHDHVVPRQHVLFTDQLPRLVQACRGGFHLADKLRPVVGRHVGSPVQQASVENDDGRSPCGGCDVCHAALQLELHLHDARLYGEPPILVAGAAWFWKLHARVQKHCADLGRCIDVVARGSGRAGQVLEC